MAYLRSLKFQCQNFCQRLKRPMPSHAFRVLHEEGGTKRIVVCVDLRSRFALFFEYGQLECSMLNDTDTRAADGRVQECCFRVVRPCGATLGALCTSECSLSVCELCHLLSLVPVCRDLSWWSFEGGSGTSELGIPVLGELTRSWWQRTWSKLANNLCGGLSEACALLSYRYVGGWLCSDSFHERGREREGEREQFPSATTKSDPLFYR